jgi:cell division protein FtsW
MSVIILMVFGVLAVYSAIAYFAAAKQTTAGSLVANHIVKLGIAFLVMLIASKIDYHILVKFSRLGMVVSWVLLIAVLLFGSEVFGARRSLNLGGFSFQPSSVAATALLIHVSVLLDEKQQYIKDFRKTFLPIMFWIVITCGLIGVEDFSSAGLLMGMCMLLMFIGRISMLQLGTLVLVGVIGGTALIMQSPERQSRIQHYIDQVVDINSDEFNVAEGYQAQQAHIAIAQGELFGVGIGKSTQRDFLPAPYNDFIFAIVAEEYGLFGSVSLILIFTIILFRGIAVIAKNAVDTIGMLIAVACTLYIVLYGFVNAGVASGLLPVTGLPMPFVSYGGTSTLFAGLLVGILMNISKHDRKKRPVFYV